MILRRLKTLLRRRRAASRLGIEFDRTSNFSLPEKISLNGRDTTLLLPREHGVEVAFVELLLDDCYMLEKVADIIGEVRRIIDVGANVGLFEIAARQAFRDSVIHAYEPNASLECYLANQSLVTNAVYDLVAVGREAGFVRLDLDLVESVHTSSHLDPSGSTIQISLREAVARIGGSVDLLKMDCEGAEWDMLNDTEVWKSVRLITMEYHLCSGLDHSSIVALLDSRGMRVIEQHKCEGFGLLLAQRQS